MLGLSEKRMEEVFGSSTGMSADDIRKNMETINQMLNDMGIPHFLAVGFIGEEDGNRTVATNIKCRSKIEALFEIFSQACLSEDHYLEFFISIGEAMKKAKETGIIDAIREAKQRASDNMSI